MFYHMIVILYEIQATAQVKFYPVVLKKKQARKLQDAQAESW